MVIGLADLGSSNPVATYSPCCPCTAIVTTESSSCSGIEQVLTTPRSPCQNAYVERVIGSVRRECLDHVIIIDERHLKRVLKNYLGYYHQSRTHLGLEKDCPEPRAVELPERGQIESMPDLGGMHHRYFRQAA